MTKEEKRKKRKKERKTEKEKREREAETDKGDLVIKRQIDREGMKVANSGELTNTL